MPVPLLPWSYWPRPEGGFHVWDEHDTGSVIGHVAAGDDVADGWVARPKWAGGMTMVGPFTSRVTAARALWDAWKADPDVTIPAEPQP